LLPTERSTFKGRTGGKNRLRFGTITLVGKPHRYRGFGRKGQHEWWGGSYWKNFGTLKKGVSAGRKNLRGALASHLGLVRYEAARR